MSTTWADREQNGRASGEGAMRPQGPSPHTPTPLPLFSVLAVGSVHSAALCFAKPRHPAQSFCHFVAQQHFHVGFARPWHSLGNDRRPHIRTVEIPLVLQLDLA